MIPVAATRRKRSFYSLREFKINFHNETGVGRTNG